jgi:hypothetical protein
MLPCQRGLALGSPPAAAWIVETPLGERATDAMSCTSSTRYSPRSISSGSS